MRIIIEEHKYAAANVKDVLKGVDALENFEGYVSMNYIGYFYFCVVYISWPYCEIEVNLNGDIIRLNTK